MKSRKKESTKDSSACKLLWTILKIDKGGIWTNGLETSQH